MTKMNATANMLCGGLVFDHSLQTSYMLSMSLQRPPREILSCKSVWL